MGKVITSATDALLFFTFLMCGFGSAVANRTLDPLTLALAQDFSVTAAAAALVVSITFLPYALVQPVFGPIGDHFGKDRVIKIALWTVALGTMACAFAPVFWMLLALRVMTGAASGGIIPVTQALIGDLVKPAERQVVIARFTMSMILGQMAGASVAGILETWIGWRGVLFGCGVIVVFSAIMATRYIPSPSQERTQGFSVARVLSNYRTIFRNPRAWVCYATVPVMGGLGFGLLPFISPVLEAQKNGGIREAGFIIAAQAFGSLLLSLALPLMLKFIPRPMMVIGGALMVAISLALFAMGWHWSVQMAIFVFFGFGWFMQHNTIQFEVSEISQDFRGSAYSMHAFFFFTGQFLGPIVYGQMIPAIGIGPALTIAAVLMGLTGILSGLAFAHLSRVNR